MKTLRVLILGLGLVALAALPAGCQETQRGGDGFVRKSSTPPSYMMSINELGQRLGMSVAIAGNPYYELKDANNRVVVQTRENGRVLVNGRDIGQVGPVVDVNGTYYVAEILLPQIRPHLEDGSPAWTPAPQPAPSPWRPPTASGVVVIDPGHGGRDPGATSVLGYPEKTLVLQISRRVAAILERRGVEVIMTRQSDTFVELEERAAIANRANADLFVSIHADWNDDSSHRGFTLYIANAASNASRRAARSLENAFLSARVPGKGIRTADFRVLVRTSGPAVLIETGFLSNPTDARLLTQAEHQDRLATAIAEGILSAL